MINLLLHPMRFLAALKLLAGKRLVPTALDTAQLQELDASIRRQALFSARMTQLHALHTLQDGLKGMLEGEDNLATAKLKMTQMYRALGYDAEAGGFPQDKAGTVPPARPGSLKDLASDKRMNLTLTTNYRVVANQVFAAKGLEKRRLHQWPAWELVRIGRVHTPRGFRRRKGGAMEPVPGDDWQARFVAAGGELYDKGTRMIALKTSGVWQKLGDGVGGYKDTLGNPFAPFAFGSKYGVREVARDECLLQGVLKPDEQPGKPGPSPVPVAQCKASAAGLDPAFIAAMKRDLAKQEDGSLRLKRELDRELAKADESYRSKNLRNRMEMLCMLMNARTKNPSAAVRKGWITRRRQRAQIRAGTDALTRAVKGADVEKAMMIPGLGFIDFMFGARGAKRHNEHGATHWGGWGVMHVDSKRGKDAIKALPIVLAKGRVLPHDLEKNKRYIKYAGWTAVVKRRQKDRWSVTSLIDDDVKPRTQKPPQNREDRLPLRSTGPTTQVRTGLEFPGSTHARQLFAKTGAGAAKGATLTTLRNRCKALMDALERRAA